MQHAQHNRDRRAAVCIVLAAVLGLVSLTLTQCTNVGDRLTGVSLDRQSALSCIKQCNDAAKLQRDEFCKKNFQTAQGECNLLPEPDRTACLNEATAAKEACNAAANAQKEQCHASCHIQGAGSAG